MKKYIAHTILFITSILLLAGLIGILSGCTHTRQVAKSEIVIDSSAAELYKDSLRIVRDETSYWKSKAEENEYNTVEFDSTKCPPTLITIDEHCNADSVRHILEAEYSNKVKINADGSREYVGKIKNFKYLTQKQIEEISSYKLKIDSLRVALAEKKTEYKTVTVTKEVKSKTKVLNFWWLLVIGIVIGWILKGKFGGGFSNIKFFGTNK